MAGISRRLHGRRGLKSLIIEAKSFVDGSSPSRAAWIEIYVIVVIGELVQVAAFTGGVD